MSRDARPEGLSRRHRFSTPGAFGPVLRGSRKMRGALTVLHILQGRPGVSRLGIALTRRLVPDAVDRNRIKRTMRDLFRRHPVKHLGLDCVISLRERYARAQQPAFREEVARLLDQAARGAR
jgi:ribonuclease P protein component